YVTALKVEFSEGVAA
nr:II-65=respiratory protein {N-terminal, clone II-65} [Chlamydomonas reinhardtii=green alga, membranes, imported proteins, Peptide Mitochondrial Partial, 15 aa] [Chlamydomonas reinhardtii]